MDALPRETEAHQIRITTQGKIRLWVEFALNHFKTSSTPLSLHTLPATQPEPQAEKTAGTADEAQSTHRDSKERGISMSTSTISRLVSVVEIIKREYLNTSEKTVLSGLHQYNEINYLERESNDTEFETGDRTQTLATALEGKNYPKEKKSAYMRITLSKSALHHLTDQGATYQSPSERKLSKSMKARARKRQRKGEAEGGVDTAHIQ